MRRYSFLILWWLLVSTQGTAAPSTLSELLTRVQQTVETRLTLILRSVDSRGVVLVHLKPSEEVLRLPMTPLILKQQEIEGSNGLLRLGRINVTVLTERETLPAGVEQFMREACSDFAQSVTIQLKKLPPEGAPNALSNVPPNKTILGVSSTGDHSLETAIFVGLSVLLSTGLMLLSARARSKKWQALLKSTVKKLGTAIGGTDFSAGRSAVPVPAAQTPVASATLVSGTAVASPSEEGLYSQLPLESWLGLLTDCYWTEQDGYAAFLWRQVPYPLRQKIAAHFDFLNDYIAYISDLETTDLKRADEASYLAPLSIHQIDNTKLTELVKKYPGLSVRMSSLRLEALHLSPTERIALARVDGKKATMPPELSIVSPRRVLAPRSYGVAIRTLDEEREALAITDMPLGFMKHIPSLGWLCRLPSIEQERVLEQFSARELASAWVGPPEVLRELTKQLSPKKLELLNSYLEKTIPSRQSDTFRSLHGMAVAWLNNAARTRNEKEAKVKMVA